MKKILITLLICCNLTACTYFLKPYRPPVQQGNVITDEAITGIKLGMLKSQVVNLLGTPVLANPLNPDTWNYVYTFQPSKGPMKTKKLVIYFRNNRVAGFSGDIPSPHFAMKYLPMPKK